ncbi:MAG: GIY-YIG nuclease family protein [Devosia sp.]
MLTRQYFVYILASGRNGTLYVGVINDLIRRVAEHKAKSVSGFTKRYGVDKLMWFEATELIEAAIIREKQIKKWNRAWKIELFRDTNPNWDDLYPSIARL